MLPKFRAGLLRDALERNMTVAHAKIGNVYTPLEKNVSHLYDLLGGWRSSSEHITFSHIFRYLISHGIALFDRWVARDSSEVNLDYHPILSLNDGNLALHLFRLKNGSQVNRDIFSSIQETYSHITGTQLDVVVREHVLQNQNGKTQMAHVIVDRDIPLSYSGSGRTQVAFLVSAMHLVHGVLLLDEPDTFLHPSIQAKLINSWQNRKVQSIIVTHSPYMVPIGGLEHVRRIFTNHKLSSSSVSPKFSRKNIKQLGLPRQIKRADEAMFLFAKCVVLVEGYDEQIALPIWFDKWLKMNGRPSSEALGIRFHAAFGKTGIMPLARIAEAYGVRWVALFDADIMSANSNNRNDNQRIIKQLVDAKLIKDGDLVLGEEKSIQQFPIGPRRNVFVRGTKLKDNWETLKIYPKWRDRLVDEIGGGPMISRFMADEEEPPSEFNALFDRILELAES